MGFDDIGLKINDNAVLTCSGGLLGEKYIKCERVVFTCGAGNYSNKTGEFYNLREVTSSYTTAVTDDGLLSTSLER